MKEKRKTRLFPATQRDRILLSSGLAFSVWPAWNFFETRGLYHLFFWVLFLASTFFAVYVFQDIPQDKAPGRYAETLSQVRKIGQHVSALGEFLEDEQRRVSETEATLRQLQSEKENLEPVVLTHRETVDAILSLHSKRVASGAWKERIAGFASGVVASIVAGYIYDLLR